MNEDGACLLGFVLEGRKVHASCLAHDLWVYKDGTRFGIIYYSS